MKLLRVVVVVAEGLPKHEVFLGGSCNPTTWRQDIAIPLLKSLGITYYNPVSTRNRNNFVLKNIYISSLLLG